MPRCQDAPLKKASAAARFAVDGGGKLLPAKVVTGSVRSQKVLGALEVINERSTAHHASPKLHALRINKRAQWF